MGLRALFAPGARVRLVAWVVVLFSLVGMQVGASPRLMSFLFLAGLTTVISVTLVAWLGNSQGAKEAKAFAKAHRWEYHASLPGLFSQLFTAPFDAPYSRYVHVVKGTFGGFECYDGIYETRVEDTPDAMVASRFRVAALRLPDELPRFMVVPGGAGVRLGSLLTFANARFESSEFNRDWRVIADDPRIAHDLLSPRVIERLNRLANKAPMVFESGLAVRIDDETADLGSLADRLGGLVAVASYLPQHTVEDHGRLANSIGPLPVGGDARRHDPGLRPRDDGTGRGVPAHRQAAQGPEVDRRRAGTGVRSAGPPRQLA